MRRTAAASSLAAARASYRRLVAEGHSPEDIDAAYDHYVRWVKAEGVKHVMGLASWLESENGFALNDISVKSKRQAAVERQQAQARANPGAGQQAATAGEGDYHAQRAALRRALPGDEYECRYVFEYADSSSDQHARELAAFIRQEKPLTLSNGYVDERLHMRPSYEILSRLVHNREHIREYTQKTFSALKAEGKVR